jgi:hypothetical protein
MLGGIYATTTLTDLEPNLVAANIASGTIMFGITGTYDPIDITLPVITSFTIPDTASDLTVSISTFTATDNIGVTGYLVNESASTPAIDDPSWSGSAQTEYTFDTDGSKTLYAWAKDEAGNISTSTSDSVTITLADAIPPSITAFIVPGPFNSLTVNIMTFTATDNIGVTGYVATESAVPPAANDPSWSGTAPTEYTFDSDGPKTLYAYAKDAAGNVAVPETALIDIVLGLTWSAIQTSNDWQDAGSTVCAGMGVGWRLPTLTELVDAMTDQFTNSGSNPGGFVEFDIYWSSTDTGPDDVWVATGGGTNVFTSVESKAFSRPFRCVN